MTYTGQFRNINNILYQVDIQINNDLSGTTEIMFSDEPFTVDYNDGDTIFEPLKLSNATCTILSENYLFDLYSSTAQGTKITLTNVDENKVEWVGYVTPNIYNQNWENNIESIEIEAIDGLSTLDNYKYITIDSDNKKMKSFQDILLHCIKQCNCYNNIYINQNNYLSSKTTDTRIYNELTYHYITSDYLNWGYLTSNYPVTSELKITVNGTDNYTIAAGYKQSDTNYRVNDLSSMIVTPESDSTYFYVNNDNLVVGTGYTTTTVIDHLYISEQNFFTSNDDNNDGLKDGKSYKEVLTSLLQYLGYTITAKGSDLYILDYDYLKNGYTDYTLLSTSDNWSTYSTSTVTVNDIHNIVGEDFKKNGSNIELTETYNQVVIKTSENKVSTLLPDFFDDNYLTNIKSDNALWNDYEQFYNGDNTYLQKFYKNSQWKTYYYNDDVNWQEQTFNTLSNNILATKIGASFVREASFKSADNVANASFTDYICLHRHLEARNNSSNQSQFDTYKNTLHPLITLNAGNIPEAAYLYNNYYLVINGSALWDDRGNTAYIDDSLSRDNDTGIESAKLKITASLKIGDKYWNGITWGTGATTFNIYFDKGTEKHLYYNWFEVKNNVTYKEWLDQSGQKIAVSKTDKLVGDVEFSIYTPQSVMNSYRVDCVWLKDFKISLVKPSQNIKDDTDTEYRNVINSNFVNDFSDLTLDVISDTNKGLNYSVVIEKVNEELGYRNNTTLCTKSLEINQKPEFNLIQKIVHQYQVPRKKLNITLGNEYKPYTLFTCDKFQNEKFIIDKMSIDYYNDNNTLTIVEKF